MEIDGIKRVYWEIAFSHLISCEDDKVSDHLDELLNGEGEKVPYTEMFENWPQEEIYEFTISLSQSLQTCSNHKSINYDDRINNK